MTAFVLLGATRLPPDPGPGVRHAYDEERQLWMDTEHDEPVVSREAGNAAAASRFGETTLTETREGADQTEVSGLQASRFGETTLTKTHEGTDQSEIAQRLETRYGETVCIATREGIDQSEVSTAA